MAPQTLVIAGAVSATSVQTLPTFRCHCQATVPVAFDTLADSTLATLCVTVDGVNATVTTG